MSFNENNDEGNDSSLTQCPYCGSRIDPQEDICPFCRFDFGKKEIVKIKKKPYITNQEKKVKKSSELKKVDLDLFEETKPVSKKTSIVFFVFIFSLLLVVLVSGFYMMGVDVFNVKSYSNIITDESVEGKFIGSWKLIDMPNMDQVDLKEEWVFYDNSSLKITQKFNTSKSDYLSPAETFVDWKSWRVDEGKLIVYTLSYGSTCEYYQVEKFDYTFPNKKGLKLTFKFQNIESLESFKLFSKVE